MTRGRYRLTRGLEASGGRGKRGLEIEVFDINTGKARPTATLSGGETFIAALALALGLADVVESLSGKIRMDTIFIDEGFGSLDTENGAGTLDQVIQVLAALTEGSRAVGLISHVGLVQEAIPQGFYVRSTPSGSRVEERTGRFLGRVRGTRRLQPSRAPARVDRVQRLGYCRAASWRLSVYATHGAAAPSASALAPGRRHPRRRSRQGRAGSTAPASRRRRGTRSRWRRSTGNR